MLFAISLFAFILLNLRKINSAIKNTDNMIQTGDIIQKLAMKMMQNEILASIHRCHGQEPHCITMIKHRINRQ